MDTTIWFPRPREAASHQMRALTVSVKLYWIWEKVGDLGSQSRLPDGYYST